MLQANKKVMHFRTHESKLFQIICPAHFYPSKAQMKNTALEVIYIWRQDYEVKNQMFAFNESCLLNMCLFLDS